MQAGIVLHPKLVYYRLKAKGAGCFLHFTTYTKHTISTRAATPYQELTFIFARSRKNQNNRSPFSFIAQ
jgi:adenosylmethionine-8-amino-7-oxononanoate aminotransferase